MKKQFSHLSAEGRLAKQKKDLEAYRMELLLELEKVEVTIDIITTNIETLGGMGNE